LMQLIICLLIINYWVTPFPGASFGFNHLFSYFAQVIVAALDQNSLTQLQNALSTALNGTPQPSYLAPMEILTYLLVYIFVGLAGGILFLINCSSFIFYGVAALFGPIFVPLLMTRTFRGKFYNFVDVLLSFAMIRAVASAFIFVWSGFLITFLQQTFNGDYSLPMWIANLYGVIAVFIAFILNMTMVPTITQTLFGGGSGAAGRVAQFARPYSSERQRWRRLPDVRPPLCLPVCPSSAPVHRPMARRLPVSCRLGTVAHSLLPRPYDRAKASRMDSPSTATSTVVAGLHP